MGHNQRSKMVALRLLIVAAFVAAALAAPMEDNTGAPEPATTKAPEPPTTKAPEPPTTKAPEPTTTEPEPTTQLPSTKPPQPPCPCDVCFSKWHAEAGQCRDIDGNWFKKMICKKEAFESFFPCWLQECIISTEACAGRPLPDIDDDDLPL